MGKSVKTIKPTDRISYDIPPGGGIPVGDSYAAFLNMTAKLQRYKAQAIKRLMKKLKSAFADM